MAKQLILSDENCIGQVEAIYAELGITRLYLT